MIEPPSDFFIRGTTSLTIKNGARTLISKILSHAFSGHSNILPINGLTAAFETNISIRPNIAIVSRNKDLRSSANPTWHLHPCTCKKPNFFNSSTALVTFLSFLLLITIEAPSDASLLAIARPILIEETFCLWKNYLFKNICLTLRSRQ